MVRHYLVLVVLLIQALHMPKRRIHDRVDRLVSAVVNCTKSAAVVLPCFSVSPYTQGFSKFILS